MVADQQQLRAGGLDVAVDRGQVRGVGHRGLVDDDQVARRAAARRGRRRPRGLVGEAVLGGEPAGDVAGGEAFAGEDLGGDLAGGQPDHASLLPVPQVGVLPGLGERADDEGLAGAGRADQRLDLRAGGEDAAHGGGLVGAELDPGLGEPGRRTPLAAVRLSAGAPRCDRGRGAGRVRCGHARGWRRAARRARRRPSGRRPAAARRAASSAPGRRRSARAQWLRSPRR